jgi:hypothetical protein
MREEAQLLQLTKARLNRVGWVQGSYHGPKGEECLGSALCHTQTEAHISLTAADRVWTWLDRECAMSLTCWNDASSRTFADVEALLDKAIVKFS